MIQKTSVKYFAFCLTGRLSRNIPQKSPSFSPYEYFPPEDFFRDSPFIYLMPHIHLFVLFLILFILFFWPCWLNSLRRYCWGVILKYCLPFIRNLHTFSIMEKRIFHKRTHTNTLMCLITLQLCWRFVIKNVLSNGLLKEKRWFCFKTQKLKKSNRLAFW